MMEELIRAIRAGKLDNFINLLNSLKPADSDRDQLFNIAAYTGKLDIVKYLWEHADSSSQERMMKSKNYMSFHLAVDGDHVAVLRYLFQVSSPNSSAYYLMLKKAVSDDNTGIMDCLFEYMPPDRVQAILTMEHGGLLKAAVHKEADDEDISFDRVYRLLSFPELFVYAETHGSEYQTYVDSFRDYKLQALHTRALADASSQGVFDVSAREAQLCMVFLLHLIRAPSPDSLENIRFLMSIPAVRSRLHLTVGPGNGLNELLRLALSTNNRDVVADLLAVPEVRTLAELNNLYSDPGHVDLSQVAANRESSMQALSSDEEVRLGNVHARYNPMMISAGGVEAVFSDFKHALEARYRNNPATIRIDNEEVALPLTRAEFDALVHDSSWSNEARDRALLAYYQHPDHSALRYMSKPNLWMSPEARFVNRGEGYEGWANFEDHKGLLCLLWLAARDAGIAPSDGHTLDSRIDWFIHEVALIGRSHNWDRTRPVRDAAGALQFDVLDRVITEEFDDGEGDKPSCGPGVKKRLFQSVLGHSLLNELTLEGVKQELRGFVRNYFIAHINTENCAQLREAWDHLVETGESNACFTALNIPPEAQHRFIEYLTNKYQAQFNNHLKIAVETSFALSEIFPCHVLRFAGEVGLEALFNKPHLLDPRVQTQVNQMIESLTGLPEECISGDLRILVTMLTQSSWDYLGSTDLPAYKQACKDAFHLHEKACHQALHPEPRTLFEQINHAFRCMFNLIDKLCSVILRRKTMEETSTPGAYVLVGRNNFFTPPSATSVGQALQTFEKAVEALDNMASPEHGNQAL